MLKKKNGVIGDRSIMHPEREWFFGILGGVVFLIAGVMWSVSIYSQFSNVSTDTTTEITDGSTYNEGLVESALSDLSERERSYQELEASLLNNPAPVFDEPEEESEVVTEEAPIIEGGTEEDPAENDEEPVVDLNEAPTLVN